MSRAALSDLRRRAHRSAVRLPLRPRLEGSSMRNGRFHTSSPPSLDSAAVATANAPAVSPSPDSSASSASPSSSTASSAQALPSVWYPPTPSSISPTAARRVRRRLRFSDPSRPPLHSLAVVDPSTQALSYTVPPPTAAPRRYQLHVPELSTVCSFRIVHAAKEYIHQASLVFEEQAHKLNLYLKAIVPLPTSIESFTFLRSPHVDKQSKEQFEIRRHKRLVTIQLDEQRRAHEERQVLKLMARTTGMVSPRVTITYRVPAGVEVRTMTFRGKEGRGEGRAPERDVVWETDLADEDPYAAEDEDFELTEEDALWGEDGVGESEAQHEKRGQQRE